MRPIANQSCSIGNKVVKGIYNATVEEIGSHADSYTDGEIVFLKNVRVGISQPILTPPLTSGERIKLRHDHIDHDSILGQSLSSGLATTAKKVLYRICRPTMAEYIDNSARLVTPVSIRRCCKIPADLERSRSIPKMPT